MSRFRPAAAILLLCAAVWIAYFPAIRAGYVWDDKLLVTENPLVTGDHLSAIWLATDSADYTPATISSFWMEWHLWGASAMGFHLVNILLHTVAVLLLWRTLRALDVPGAWLGALIFAVHPVNAASVAWIAERKNTLSLVFYLSAILGYLDYDRRGKLFPLSIALLSAVAAFLSKGSTVILPAVMLLCIWWRHGKIGRKDLIAISPFALIAGLTAIVTAYFQSRIIRHATQNGTLFFRIARAGDAAWFYLWKDVWPMGLCAIYPKWNVHYHQLAGWLPLAAGVALICVLFQSRSLRGVQFAIACYLVSLLPVLGFVRMSYLDQAYVADWWQQLALVPLTALAGAGAAFLAARLKGGMRAAFHGLVAMACLGLAWQTWSEARSYGSMEIYSRKAIAGNPSAWAAHDNLGNVLKAQGKLPEAISEYRQALKINPSNALAESNLGSALQAKGKIDEALNHYRKALALDANSIGAYNNLALLLNSQGQPEAAIALYHKALHINAALPEVHNNLGLALKQKGALNEAIAEFREALRLRPSYADAYSNLGDTANAIGDYAGGEAACRRALALNPELTDAINNLGNSLLAQNRLGEAIEEYRKILLLKPADAKAHYNMGLALQKLGRLEDAVSEYRAALRSQPGMPPATLNLAQAYAALNRIPEALACLEEGLRLPMPASDRESILSLRNDLLKGNPAPEFH